MEDFGYWMYVISAVLILPAIIFALVAQWKVHSAFSEYSSVGSHRGVTAASLARKLLDENDCGDVSIERTRGHLSDHYDPRKRVVRLSGEIHDSTSLAALGIAAHEVGHAIQHKTGYGPFRLRQIVIKSTRFVNVLIVPLIIISILASIFVTSATIFGFKSYDFFFGIIIAFCVLYGISFLINLITLPTEYNASSRAKEMLSDTLLDEEEKRGVNKVLRAAALTYVAGLVVSLVYLLRFLGLALMLAGRRK